MIKLFVWPLTVLLSDFYVISWLQRGKVYNGFGWEIVAAMTLHSVLLLSLGFYGLLIVAYMIGVKKTGQRPRLLTSLGLGIVSIFLAPAAWPLITIITGLLNGK